MIRSIGMATDAMFAAFDGAVIDRGEYVVVSTPKNPTFFWQPPRDPRCAARTPPRSSRRFVARRDASVPLR
ncbi:MAG TPA: hypothetical protein VH054_25275 [Polyangiaceae bacterium]|jgi:hypothetical protein|nr:hypothetical protein [Polyangiaceae bacterium]